MVIKSFLFAVFASAAILAVSASPISNEDSLTINEHDFPTHTDENVFDTKKKKNKKPKPPKKKTGPQPKPITPRPPGQNPAPAPAPPPQPVNGARPPNSPPPPPPPPPPQRPIH